MRILFGMTVAALLGACVTPQAATRPAPEPEPPAAAAPAPTADQEGHTNVQPLLDDDTGATKAFTTKPQPGDKAICAVSNEPFTVTAETKTAEHEGRWYAFCCDECAPEFAADPAKFTAN